MIIMYLIVSHTFNILQIQWVGLSNLENSILLDMLSVFTGQFC